MKGKRYTNEQLMREVPVSKAVLSLALPTLLGALMGLIYNLTDTFFIGMLNDYTQIASLSLALPVTIIIGAIGSLISGGAPSYISRKYGAGDLDAVKRASAFSFYATIALGIIATAIMLPALNPLLRLMGTSEQTHGHTMQYLTILVGATVLNLSQGTLQGMLRAEGQTKAASIGSIIGIAANILLDPLLIFALNMGIAGAALATVCSHICSMAYFLWKLHGGDTVLSIRPKDFSVDIGMIKGIASVGASAMLSSLIICVPIMFGNRFAAGYGDGMLAAIGVASKLMTIVATISMGFAMGLQPFIGYNHGAGNYERMRSGMLCSAGYGTLMCVAFAALFGALPEMCIGMFSSEPEVLELGTRMLRLFLISIPFSSMQTTCTTYLQSTGQALKATILTVVKQFGVFIPLAIILQRFIGLDGLMISQPLADLAATIFAAGLTVHSVKALMPSGKPAPLTAGNPS